MMHFGYNGLIGVLVLAGDIWAILNIFQSSVSNEKKIDLDNRGSVAARSGSAAVVLPCAAQWQVGLAGRQTQ